jgi:hypothetical protein
MDKFCNKIPYAILISTWEAVEAISFDVWEKNNICCPYCKDSLIFKWSHSVNLNGTRRKEHFSHKSKAVCVNKVSSEWESLLHKDGKEYIYNLLNDMSLYSPDFEIILLKKEYQLMNDSFYINRIADVYVEFNYKWQKYKQAYEIQYSNICEEELLERHSYYNKLWIKDIWLVWLQFQTFKNKDLDFTKIYIDEQIQNPTDLNSWIFNINDVSDERPFLNRFIDKIDNFPQKMMWKSISLFDKISKFQEIVYFITPNWLYLPKYIEHQIHSANSKDLYNNTKITDVNKIKKILEEWKNHDLKINTSYILWITKQIDKNYMFDYNIINIEKTELNELFFISWTNTLFQLSDSEKQYRDNTLRKIQTDLDKEELYNQKERYIEKFKYTKVEYSQLYFIRLLVTLLFEIHNNIELNKELIAKKQGDSYQWINKIILTKKWGDNNKYWLFSSVNKVLSDMSHIIPSHLAFWIKKIISCLGDIKIFLWKLECDMFIWYSYENYINHLKDAFHKHFTHPNLKYQDNNNNETFSNSIFIKYWIKTVLNGYCQESIYNYSNNSIDLYIYKTFYEKGYDNLVKIIDLEYNELTKLYNEIQDIYFSRK